MYVCMYVSKTVPDYDDADVKQTCQQGVSDDAYFTLLTGSISVCSQAGRNA